MLSKNKIKLITSLARKKYRDEYSLFVAEGSKLVTDLSVAFRCRSLFATKEWLSLYPNLIADEIIEVSEAELTKVSAQKTPQGVIALFEKMDSSFQTSDVTEALTLALDDVQDPGNLGTILRVADWFGIRDVFCSEHCADAFNPKTVQATMGALARVKVHKVNLTDFLKDYTSKTSIYGTLMDGNDIYHSELQPTGIVVMGNEGQGISPEVQQLISHRLLIPSYPQGIPTSESLNVSVATALVCAEFRRRLR